MPSIDICLTNVDAKMPTRGSLCAAGYDFYSPCDIELVPKDVTKIPLGLAVAIQDGFFLQLMSRSGLAFKHGIRVIAGTIDSDYRGEVVVGLWNDSMTPLQVKKGDRVCQGVLLPVLEWNVQRVEKLPETVRGTGGFGSTDKK